MLRSFVLGGSCVALYALVFGAPAQGGAGGKFRHPHLHHALYELKEVRAELKKAEHNFGGHREKALIAVDEAIVQIDLALTGGSDPFKGYKTPFEAYKKYTHHPHLHHALHELKEARTELKEASHDFGGHRERALRDVHTAITQLELCLKFAKRD